MKVYYDQGIDISMLKDKVISIIGYGIQGRAQALNLRDSGCRVVVGNIRDKYYKQAKEDGFKVMDIDKASQQGEIILFLIPDNAQKAIYNEVIMPNLAAGKMIVFAHGYSVHYGEIVPSQDIDVCLLAPRMPGKQIRDYYLKGGGVPAFVYVHQDATGVAQNRLLALAKAMGFTRAGAMEVSFKEETELDLFIEQFLLPTIIRAIRLSFDTLIEEGFTPEPTLMELYASGEIGELLMMAANQDIYKVWRENASPTCQAGIYRNSETVMPEARTKEMIRKVIRDLRDGTFTEYLAKEAKSGYSGLKKYDKDNESARISRTQARLNDIIKYRVKE